MTVVAVLVGLALLAGLGIWLALQHNPHRVLDTVDRIVGPGSDVERVHAADLGDDPRQKLFVYRDGARREGQPVFLFLHGGGWRHGDPEHYAFIARSIAPEGYIVVLGGYRLGEQGRYPAMLEDTSAAIAWTHANIARFGGDPERILLGGHSAGAYNIVQTVLEARWLEGQGVPRTAIRGVVGLAGPYDFFPFDTDSSRSTFGSVDAGAGSQPVNHARSDAPPMLLVHGEADIVVRPRNSRALAKALGEVGGKVETLYLPGADHNAPLLALANPWRRDPEVRDRILEFLGEAGSVSVSVQAETP